MLTVDECVRIARNACINMFGEEFVNKHKEGFSSARCADPETGLFEYTLLYAPLDRDDMESSRFLIDNRPFDYYASVVVDMKTGEVIVDPDKSKTKLPG